MNQLYQKSQTWFAVLWIGIYVIGSSVADELSRRIGFEKSVTLIFEAAVLTVLLLFLKKNGLTRDYGLCRPAYPASRFLYFIPLALLSSVNLWFGAQINRPAGETLCYILSMLLVGFVEELIFRGLLFRALSRENVKTAVVVSSVTFGIGHLVNLINGSNTDLAAGICQVCYAVAVGFLFVILFYRGKSLWPCILAHGILNSLSVFAREELASRYQIPVSAALIVLSLGYALILMKTLPKQAGR